MLILTIGWIFRHSWVSLLSTILLDTYVEERVNHRLIHRQIDVHLFKYQDKSTGTDADTSFKVYNSSNENIISYSFVYADEDLSDSSGDCSVVECKSRSFIDGFTIDRINLWLELHSEDHDQMLNVSKRGNDGRRWSIGYDIKEQSIILAYGSDDDDDWTSPGIKQVEWYAVNTFDSLSANGIIRLDIWHLLSASWHRRITMTSSYRYCESLAYASSISHNFTTKSLITSISSSWNEMSLFRSMIFEDCEVDMVTLLMSELSKYHLLSNKLNDSKCNILSVVDLSSSEVVHCIEDVLLLMSSSSELIEYISLDEFVILSLKENGYQQSPFLQRYQLESFRRWVNIIRAASNLLPNYSMSFLTSSFWRYLYMYQTTGIDNCSDSRAPEMQESIVEKFFAASASPQSLNFTATTQNIIDSYQFFMYKYRNQNLSMQAVMITIVDTIKACLWNVDDSIASIPASFSALCAEYPIISVCLDNAYREQFVITITNALNSVFNGDDSQSLNIETSMKQFDDLTSVSPSIYKTAIALRHLLVGLAFLSSEDDDLPRIPMISESSGKFVSISSEADAFIFIFVDFKDLSAAQQTVYHWKDNCHQRLCTLYMQFFVVPFIKLSYISIFKVASDMIHRYTSSSDFVIILIGIDAVFGFPQPSVSDHTKALFPQISYGQQAFYGLKTGQVIVSETLNSLAAYSGDLAHLLQYMNSRDRIPSYTAYDQKYIMRQIYCHYNRLKASYPPIIVDYQEILYKPTLVSSNHRLWIQSSSKNTDIHSTSISCPPDLTSNISAYSVKNLQVNSLRILF